MKLGAVVLTGDFNKAVEREAPSGDFGDRRISPLEAAFSHANVPRRPTAVGPGGEPNSGKWQARCAEQKLRVGVAEYGKFGDTRSWRECAERACCLWRRKKDLYLELVRGFGD